MGHLETSGWSKRELRGLTCRLSTSTHWQQRSGARRLHLAQGNIKHAMSRRSQAARLGKRRTRLQERYISRARRPDRESGSRAGERGLRLRPGGQGHGSSTRGGGRLTQARSNQGPTSHWSAAGVFPGELAFRS